MFISAFNFAACIFCFCIFLNVKDINQTSGFIMAACTAINMFFGIYNSFKFLEGILK